MPPVFPPDATAAMQRCSASTQAGYALDQGRSRGRIMEYGNPLQWRSMTKGTNADRV
ncbi:hypothetical protein IG631_15412 [Alternaria alternata]|nr:hypothetical protein IG631_15412 [Alternaria alternata]